MGSLGAAQPAGSVQSRDLWLLMRLLSAAQSVPRIADRLIAERGSLGSVLSASEERLRQLGADSNGVAIISLIREAIRAVADRPASDSRRIDRSEQLVDILYADMVWMEVEEFRAAFLDSGQRLIRIETLGRGSVNAAPVYPREVARRALELNAAAVILVHNHPSGDPRPSAADTAISRRVAAALATLDVVLVDHIIIGRGGWARAMQPLVPVSDISTDGISTASH